ncbi:MAG: hypothetical protein ACK6DA_16100 [Candidatus Kapaibacterium sp.]
MRKLENLCLDGYTKFRSFEGRKGALRKDSYVLQFGDTSGGGFRP